MIIKRYSRQLKEEVIQAVLRDDRRLKEVAAEYKVDERQIIRWMKKMQAPSAPSPAHD